MNKYIMNRESLKRHCEAMCHKFKDIPTSGTYGEHRLVLELLEQTEWIPVSERLPDEVGTYMTTVDYEKHGIAVGQRYYHGKGLGWEDDCVIAWMSLPKPFEPQERSENVT